MQELALTPGPGAYWGSQPFQDSSDEVEYRHHRRGLFTVKSEDLQPNHPGLRQERERTRIQRWVKLSRGLRASDELLDPAGHGIPRMSKFGSKLLGLANGGQHRF
jgi:hypothetical protein